MPGYLAGLFNSLSAYQLSLRGEHIRNGTNCQKMTGPTHFVWGTPLSRSIRAAPQSWESQQTFFRKPFMNIFTLFEKCLVWMKCLPRRHRRGLRVFEMGSEVSSSTRALLMIKEDHVSNPWSLKKKIG